ncbi:hypothetical protein [Streptomyces sp. NPDC008150]|uniref:hypothetical protein n=1 Tax=Streptomyces sp. NPDC008150 TaxID=3364816 RepID=UPI0036E11233
MWRISRVFPRIRRGGPRVLLCMRPEPAPPAVASTARPGPGEGGCLVVAVRLPLRIAVVLLVLPVRLAWDGLVAAGRFARRSVLRPLGRGLLWAARILVGVPLGVLWRYAVVPCGRATAWLVEVLVVAPLVLLYRHVLTPLGHGAAWLWAHVCVPLASGLARLLAAVGRGGWAGVSAVLRVLVAVPAAALYRWVLAPAGRLLARTARWTLRGVGLALYRTGRVLLVLPAAALWRWVLVPVGRVLAVLLGELVAALGHAWRITGPVSAAVGRFLAAVLRVLVVTPARAVHAYVLTPVGHVVRDLLLRPAAAAARAAGRTVRQALGSARDAVRRARADLRRLLPGSGAPGRAPVPVREPAGDVARTLEKRPGS